MVEKKQGGRPHYIQEWAATRGWKAADLAREGDFDPGMVSKWYSGSTPHPVSQRKLAKVFGTTPDGLFRHPDESWLVDFFAGRSVDEVRHIKKSLEVTFPKARK